MMKAKLFNIFVKAVDSVQPRFLIRKIVSRSSRSDTLKIENLSLTMHENCFVVGFGKAVYQMAVEIESIVGEHLRKGVISVPVGAANQSEHRLRNDSVIRVLEGGKNNLPDENALAAAKEIENLVKACGKNDILIVLVSGGGSALLPHPTSPVTLKEKIETIKGVSSAGATIVELNSIRTALSEVKGGKLAVLAYPATTVTLIISDIIEDPLHFIASGPTVLPNHDIPYVAASSVLEKYNLMCSTSANVREVLHRKSNCENMQKIMKEDNRLYNFIIGNNRIALKAAVAEAERLQFFTVLLSHRVDTLISQVARIYTEIINHLCTFLNNSNSKTDFKNNMKILQDCNEQIPYVCDITHTLIANADSINDCRVKQIPLCLIAGGEPTVEVTGSGLGGRNQELALEMGIRLHTLKNENNCIKKFNIKFASAGTDGIDGPTDAAGAMACCDLVDEATSYNLNAQTFLENNDSYSFFSFLKDSQYLIKTGHTGTNVMDIHILLINLKEK